MAEVRPHIQTVFKLDPVPVAGRTGTNVDPQCPNKKVICHELNPFTSGVQTRLPKGLVGSRCTATVKIAGQDCNCLLDTGSQVTTIPVSFYNVHFSEQPVKSLCDLLEIEGAAGQAVPYLGYIEMTIIFPCEFLGDYFDVSTLALVVPDVRDGPSSVLIGMNTLEPLYTQYKASEFSSFQPAASGYGAVLKLLQLRYNQQQVGSEGVVRLASKVPVSIPAGHTTVVEGSVHTITSCSDQWALVEHPTTPLPGGLCVRNCLIKLSGQSSHKVAVILTNQSDQEVSLPPLCSVADLAVSPQILSHQVTLNRSPSKSSPEALKLDFAESPIPPEWKERIQNKLNEIPNIFSHHDLDFGCTDKVNHHIKLHDETPFKHRARPIHPQDIEAVRQHLRDLLEAGVIRESESPFSSPIVVVRKKNGDIRLCIDYRKLNLQTVKDAYALPNLEESFSALTGSRWFSVLDLKSGYYQIEMNEADKAKTAFVTPIGFWEFNRMPQGVTNAPSTFQRLMEKCMGDLHLKEVLVFLDDLIVFSSTLEEHEQRLLRVLNRLKEYGLKLSPEKCKFFQTSVRYLGHVVSEKGVETDPDKISALKSWPVPRTLKELRSFLGFAGYYRRFIKGYSAIAKPLNDLTRGYAPTSKEFRRGHPTAQTQDVKQPFGKRWLPSCQLAFENLIEKLTSAPVLGFANPKQPYILHTDASTTGLGAALYQEQEGMLRVIAYASRGLSTSESRYPAHKLEFLALKWSVTEKFHDYLYGADFVVVTDNNPLTYILTSAKLDATSHRWLAGLSTYTFKLQYRAGNQNLDADALSRRPHCHSAKDTLQKDWDLIHKFTQDHTCEPGEVEEIDPEVVSAICHRCLIRTSLPNSPAESSITLVESLSMSAQAVPDAYASESHHGLPVVPSFSHHDLQDKQRADPVIREVIHQLESGERVPPTVRQELPDLALLLRELNRLELQEEVLYRRRQDNDNVSYQLVLPEELRPIVLASLHDDMGHMGIERTLDLVRSRFFWPRMASDVEIKVRTCNRCVRRKALPERSAPLVNIKTTRPLELLCMDYLSLEPDRSNTKDILVLTDHYTKFAVAIPTPNQKAKTVAKCLFENFIVCYGIPERLHTDQGPDFESKLIKELCNIAGIIKTRTTPYHPRGNPVERFNRTLLNMLGTLEPKQKVTWKEYVKPLVHAYNCTKNEVTGFAPYELMFGRSPRLPVDLAFGLPVRGPQSTFHSQYVENLRSRLEESFKIASKNAAKSAEKNKQRFDQRVTPSKLEEGDRVLVRNVRLRGKHKLEDKWEQDIYVVVKQAGDLPVYTVRPEKNADRPTRTLHRDLLLPCSFLQDSDDISPTRTPPRKAQTRSQKPAQPDLNGDQEEEDKGWDFPQVQFQPTFEFRSTQSAELPSELSNSQPQSKATTDFTPVVTVSRPVNPVNLTSEPYLPDDGEASVVSSISHSPDEVESPAVSEVHSPVGEEELEPGDHLPGSDESRGPKGSGRPEVQSDEQPELTDQAEASPSLTEPLLSLAETHVELISNSDDIHHSTVEESNPCFRRSTRQRQPPNRLQYSALGNPLISVVQTLFHSLADAYSEALSPTSAATTSSQSRVCIV